MHYVLIFLLCAALAVALGVLESATGRMAWLDWGVAGFFVLLAVFAWWRRPGG